jgi:thymidylate synthase (FAD)
MQIIEQGWEIESFPLNAPLIIEKVGRDAYQSHDRTQPGSADKFCQMLINRHHEAVLEFADIHVRITVSRSVSHEAVRHRHCSFLQESQRYVNYKEGVKFIKPWWMEKHTEGYELWLECMRLAEINYTYMVGALNMAPQEARGILPNDTATILNMKHNIRGWREIFALRTSPAAFPPMRELMLSLQAEFHNRLPVLF